MDISASLNAALPGLANATVVGLNDPIANSAPVPPAAATPAPTTPTPPAASSQAVAGVTAGGAPAAPTGAGQAAAGALPVQGGGGAIDPKLIAAFEELIEVLAALVGQLKAGATTGGGPVDPTRGGGTPGMPPGKVGGVDGGGIVQQSPIQAPVKSPVGGGGAAPAGAGFTSTPVFAPGSQLAGFVASNGGDPHATVPTART